MAGDPGTPEVRPGGRELPLQVTPCPPACTRATTKNIERNSPSQAAGKLFFPLLTEPGRILGPQAPRSPSQSSFSLASELFYSTCIQFCRAPSTNAAAVTVQENYTTCNAFFPGIKQFTSFYLFFLTQKWHLQKSSSFITKI